MIFNNPFRKTPENYRCIIIGDSITEEWHKNNPQYFRENKLACKGVSGETTHQMLMRFERDVIRLKPEWVIILGGTNDIANDLSPTIVSKIMNNITKMAEKARSNNIKVALCSVLPTSSYPWSPYATPASTIPQLNVEIMNFCNEQGFTYINFFDALKNECNGLTEKYTYDGVHCTSEAYRKMEPILREKTI